MSIHFQNLELEIQGQVATVWLNRPGDSLSASRLT